jgi:signal transduction histidine kinase
MNLYQKGLLAFVVVISIAVLTVAVLVGQRTSTEFRTYAALYSNRAQNLALALTSYYAEHGGWEGLQAALPDLAIGPGRGSGYGGVQGRSSWDFRVADAGRVIVADSQGQVEGHLSEGEAQQALPLVAGGRTVGYLALDRQASSNAPLDVPGEEFLDRLRQALVLGGLLAFVAALLAAGLLVRGIVAPVRELKDAARTIAGGDFAARASVRGRDEIAALAETFNAMAASLQRAQELRKTQTADIAHELRNPLAILQGTLEALADGIYAPEPENIQPALDQVRTLNRLVDDLRTLAQADAGELRLEKRQVDLRALLSRAAEAHRGPLAEKGIALHVALAEQAVEIDADYERLTQAVNNVLGNAARYVPEGCELRVSLEPAEGGVVVRIADNGPGVPEQTLPKLFERFGRGELSHSRVTGGSGLGLAITRHVVEAHGGRAWAETTPGGGLTIGLWLPA